MGPRQAAVEVLAALLPSLPQVAAGAAGGAGGADAAPPPMSAPSPASSGRRADPQPVDQQLRDFFRRHPSLGKRDRLQVSDRLFDVLRNLRLYQALLQASGRAEREPSLCAQELIALSQATATEPPADGTSPLSEAATSAGSERAALAALAARVPEAVRYSLPDWLWERLQASHGPRADPIAGSLLQPSPIDLRANLLVGKAEVLRTRLAQRGIQAVPIKDVPTGLRVNGRPNLEQLDLFEQGWFEVQDAGSQWIVDASGARRGQLVIDFCAGAGGKSLALASRMRNTGKVLAFDTAEERLARLKPRAQRAGARILEAMRIDGLADPRLGRYRGRADVVLVDAPCSGTGTLRRSPDLKWRLSPERLRAHVEVQHAILRTASTLVRPGGSLVYATCSLLQEENEEQVARFDRSGFEIDRSAAWLPDEGPSSSFFLAKWVLRARY